MTPSEPGAWDSDTRGRKAGVSTLLRALGSSLRGICLLWGLVLCFHLIVFCPFHKKAEFRCLRSFPHKKARILRIEGNTSIPLCLIWMRRDVIGPRHLFWVCEMRSKFSCVPTFSFSRPKHFFEPSAEFSAYSVGEILQVWHRLLTLFLLTWRVTQAFYRVKI